MAKYIGKFESGSEKKFEDTTITKLYFSGGDEDDRYYGMNGNDSLYGNGGDDKLYGNGGNDALYGGSGRDDLYGGKGDDYLSGGAHDDWLNGEEGNDRIYGGTGGDHLNGGDGNDALFGGSASDELYGGFGSDYLSGGTGADELWGNNEYIPDPTHSDRIYGGGGEDTLYIGAGDGDSAYFGQNDDDWLVLYDFENDSATYTSHHTIDGGSGTDTMDLYDLRAGAVVNLQQETASGNFFTANLTSIENVEGTIYADIIRGDDDDNRLYGSKGDDVIAGGGGDDELYGGWDNDIFIFDHDDNNESDTIHDLSIDEDKIDLGDTEVANWSDLFEEGDGDYMEQVGNDVVIHSSDNDTITLDGTNMDDLTEDNFIF